jgi:hypothetical protein
MTEDELVDDLSRLLREGLVMVDQDDLDAEPRFRPTAAGVDAVEASPSWNSDSLVDEHAR